MKLMEAVLEKVYDKLEVIDDDKNKVSMHHNEPENHACFVRSSFRNLACANHVAPSLLPMTILFFIVGKQLYLSLIYFFTF